MMNTPKFVLAPGVIVEDLGSDSVVLIPGQSEVLTLSGDAAETIRRIRLGKNSDWADSSISELLDHGVIRTVDGLSRRGVVRAGVIGVGAGFAALALPGVAAASSGGVPLETRSGLYYYDVGGNQSAPTYRVYVILGQADFVDIINQQSYDAGEWSVKMFLPGGSDLTLPVEPWSGGGNWWWESATVTSGVAWEGLNTLDAQLVAANGGTRPNPTNDIDLDGTNFGVVQGQLLKDGDPFLNLNLTWGRLPAT